MVNKSLTNKYMPKPLKIKAQNRSNQLILPNYSGVKRSLKEGHQSIGEEGSILFSDGKNLSENNDKLYWDNTNNRLGVSLPTGENPINSVDIGGNINFNTITPPTAAECQALSLQENLAGGTLAAGTYYYGVQFIDSYGNVCGDHYLDNPQITISANSSVTINGLPISTDDRVVGRRIMKGLDGGLIQSVYKLYDLMDNTSTSWTDDGTYSINVNYGMYRAPNKTAGNFYIDNVPALAIENYNTICGIEAGANVTSGNSSIFYGRGAGANNTTGSSNNFLGYYTGQGITTGGANCALGYATLFSVYPSSYGNVALGGSSCRAYSSNAYFIGNTAIGESSLLGSYKNVFYNVAIGRYAGAGIGTSNSSTGNVIIGYGAAQNTIDTGNYNIIIGYNVDPSDPDIDYELNIGNLITGNMNGDKEVIVDGFLTSKKCGVYAYISSPTNTTITTAATYYPISGTFTNSPIEGFSAATTYTPGIKYNEFKTQYFEIDWHSSLVSDTSNVTVSLGIKKNGVLISGSVMSQYCKNASQIYTLSGTCVVELAENDEIQLVITSDSNGNVVTIENYTTTISEFFD